MNHDAYNCEKLIIVGASLAGLRAVEAARQSGFTGEIVAIGAEKHLPYDRPPLSKNYLLNDEAHSPFFREPTYLTDQLNVTLMLDTRAEALDPVKKVIQTDKGEVAYDAAIIATGAEARTLPQWSGLEGVITLRTLDDASTLRQMLQPDTRITILGAGFIGSEIASAAQEKGAEVTIVEGADVPLVRAVGTSVGAELSSLHKLNGVELKCSTTLAAVHGEDKVESVELSDGTILPTDILLISIGAAPATSWLKTSGIELNPDGGVVCDEFMESTIPHVYAAGDVAYWPNEIMDSSMRLEHWTSAAEQAARAATNAIGESSLSYETVPYFWSDWYGNRIQFVGRVGPEEPVVVSGSIEEGQYAALYKENSRIIGAFTLNQPTRIMKYRKLIGRRASWEEALEYAHTSTVQVTH